MAFFGVPAAGGGGGGAAVGGAADVPSAAAPQDLFDRVTQHALAEIVKLDTDADYRTYLAAVLNACYKKNHDLLQDAHIAYVRKMRDVADSAALDTIEMTKMKTELEALQTHNAKLVADLTDQTEKIDAATAELDSLKAAVTTMETTTAAARATHAEQIAALKTQITWFKKHADAFTRELIEIKMYHGYMIPNDTTQNYIQTLKAMTARVNDDDEE